MVSQGFSVEIMNHFISLVIDCGIVSTGEADMLICTACYWTPPRSIIPLVIDSSVLPCCIHERLGRGADWLCSF